MSGAIKAKKSGVGVTYVDDVEGITIDLWDRTYVDALESACGLFLSFGGGIKPEYKVKLQALRKAALEYSTALLGETKRIAHS